MNLYRLATFNLESFGDDKQPEVELDKRIAILKPQLKRLDAEILCLQEVNAQRLDPDKPRQFHSLDRLLVDTKYERYERASLLEHPSKALAGVHNLVVLTCFPIEHVRFLKHDIVSEPMVHVMTADPVASERVPISWERPALQVSLKLPSGQSLHVFNAHLRAPTASFIAGRKRDPWTWKSTSAWAEGLYISSIKTVGQALEIRMAVDRLFDDEPDSLVVVCGDFNSEINEAAMRVTIASEEDTGSPGLAVRSLVPLERSLPADRRFSVLHHGRPEMLDHIVVSRNLLAYFHELEIHNETLADELVVYSKIDRPLTSSHAPLVAAFNY